MATVQVTLLVTQPIQRSSKTKQTLGLMLDESHRQSKEFSGYTGGNALLLATPATRSLLMADVAQAAIAKAVRFVVQASLKTG
jgi:hypothetical protein